MTEIQRDTAAAQSSEPRFITVTIEYGSDQTPPKELLDAQVLGGKVVTAALYDATSALQAAESALCVVDHPRADAALETIRMLVLAGMNDQDGADGATDASSEPEVLKCYRITHACDIGDQDIYITAAKDPTRAAVYCQYMAEIWFGEGFSLNNIAVANALTSFYDCMPAARDPDAIPIDMLDVRESLLSDWDEITHDLALRRDKLRDFLAHGDIFKQKIEA